MASLNQLSFTLRTFLKAYRWRRIDPLPMPGRLVKQTAPQVVEVFAEDDVDVVLLVPV
jgi:hypothetical protein